MKTFNEFEIFLPLLGPQILNPYDAGGKFGQYKMIKKPKNINKTVAHGFWQCLDRVQKALPPCALDEGGLSSGRVNIR